MRARVCVLMLQLLPTNPVIRTLIQVCPGSTSVVVGTDRGVLVLYDLRFHLIIAAWRHSARGPITALYP